MFATITELTHKPGRLPQFLAAPFVLFCTSVFAEQRHQPDCDLCNVAGCGQHTPGGIASANEWSGLVFIALLIVLMAYYFFRRYRSKVYLIGGIALAASVAGFGFLRPKNIPGKETGFCEIKTDRAVGIVKDTAALSEFIPINEDFEEIDKPAPDSFMKDDFQGTGDDFRGTASDEFSQVSSDEFSLGPEFAPLNADSVEKGFSETPIVSEEQTAGKLNSGDVRFLIELGILFLAFVALGFLIRYPQIRKFRGAVLLSTVVYFGFVKGGCPCMISSFQNTVLALLGTPVAWISMIWFLGLLPLTYFFGKVWCGWLCHLGALQEFLFRSSRLEILKRQKTQQILRYTRMFLLVTLLVQLVITRTNIYIHYDPFKVAFNLFSSNTTGYVLLGILLFSSVLSYRPFCRAVCPVGLILGWVSLLPGAKKITRTNVCIDCPSCAKACQTSAIVYEDMKSYLQVQDCILCGECLGSCKKQSLKLLGTK